MHPNPLFRSDDQAMMVKRLNRIGFGMVFLTTPDGPRMAHTPLLAGVDGTIRFHLSRRNALVPHLNGAQALICANGPDGYVSPRWYDDRNTVPTWDYVALEMDGPVRILSTEVLDQFLYQLVEKQEATLGGDQWQANEAEDGMWNRQLQGIKGFEMTIENWRPTFKLSQKQPQSVRNRIAAAHANNGNPSLAHAMQEHSA